MNTAASIKCAMKTIKRAISYEIDGPENRFQTGKCFILVYQ